MVQILRDPVDTGVKSRLQDTDVKSRLEQGHRAGTWSKGCKTYKKKEQDIGGVQTRSKPGGQQRIRDCKHAQEESRSHGA